MQIYQSIVWVTAIVLSGILTSCSNGERILEARDIRFDSIMEVKTSTSLGLKISGQTFLNVRRISDVKIIQEKDVLVVFVAMSIIKGKSGYLDYTIPIPNSANEIKFGNKGAVLWRRGGGTAKMPLDMSKQ